MSQLPPLSILMYEPSIGFKKRMYRWLRRMGKATDPYEPLDPEKEEIRLLRLQPGSGAEKLVGSLEIGSLSNSNKRLEYFATSYLWGDEHNSSTIEIDGFEVSIGRNLEDFLWHLRENGWDFDFWTDAICINQKDNTEKSHQIPLMERIYISTACCLVWMGESTSYTQKAIRLMEGLQSNKPLIETPAFEILDDDDETLSRLRAGEREDGWLHLVAGDGLSFVFARPARDLDEIVHEWVANPYWSRVWTLQEFALSRHKVLLWTKDKYTIDGSKFFLDRPSAHIKTPNVDAAFCYTQIETDSIAAACRPLIKIAALHEEFLVFKDIMDLRLDRRELSEEQSNDYFATVKHYSITALSNASARKCSNTRDYVYRLLGIIFIPGLPVDYKLSADVIYSHVVRCTMETSTYGNLRMFHVACDRRAEVCVPSWVPDWSSRLMLSQFPTIQWMNWYSAAESPGSCISFISERTIGVYGFCIGTITSMLKGSPARPVPRGTNPDFPKCHKDVEDMFAWLLTLETFIEASSSGGDGRQDYLPGFSTKQHDEATSQSKKFTNDLIESLLLRDINFNTYELKRNQPEDRGVYESWRREFLQLGNDLRNLQPDVQYLPNMRDATAMIFAADNYFKSDLGFYGAANKNSQPGDELWIMPGAQAPFVIRPSSVTPEGVQHRILVSNAYVHGFMDGEILELDAETGFEMRECILE